MKYYLWLLLAATTTLNAAQFTEEQKSEIGTIIRQYLLENPEVIVESVQVFQKEQQEKVAAQSQKAIFEKRKELFSKGPILGNKEGSVVLVEFLDYNCGHCRNMHSVIEELIQNNQDLKVVIKELPILGQPSLMAAKAALMAYEQGKFQEVHDAFMNEKDKLTEKRINEILVEQGLDPSEMEKQVDNLTEMLQKNLELAISIGVQATPVFVIAPENVDNVDKIYFIPGGVQTNYLQEKINEAKQ